VRSKPTRAASPTASRLRLEPEPDGRDLGLGLALELSTRAGSVALRRGDVFGEELLDPGPAHASDLLPACTRLAERLGLRSLEPAWIAVGLGPGSFTGLRVAVAIALGLARASGAALVGLPSCDACFFALLAPGETGTWIQDARAGRAYSARARRTREGDLEVLSAPRALGWDVLAAELDARRATSANERFLVDEGAQRRLGFDSGVDATLADPPRASALLELARRQWRRAGPTEPTALRPLYLFEFGQPTGTTP